MAKIFLAALVALGILWLVCDLYALDINRRFPGEESDFYFHDVTRKTVSTVTPEDISYQRIPQLSAVPEDSDDNQSLDKSDSKVQEKSEKTKSTQFNSRQMDEWNVNKLLQSFESLLYHLSDKELLNKLKALMRSVNLSFTNSNEKMSDKSSILKTNQPVKSVRHTSNAHTSSNADEYDSTKDKHSSVPERFDIFRNKNEEYYDENVNYSTEIPVTTVKSEISYNNANEGLKTSNESNNKTNHQNNKNLHAVNPAVSNDELNFDGFPRFLRITNREEIPSNEFIDHAINSPIDREKTIKATFPVFSSNETRQIVLNQNFSKSIPEIGTLSNKMRPISKSRRKYLSPPFTQKQPSANVPFRMIDPLTIERYNFNDQMKSNPEILKPNLREQSRVNVPLSMFDPLTIKSYNYNQQIERNSEIPKTNLREQSSGNVPLTQTDSMTINSYNYNQIIKSNPEIPAINLNEQLQAKQTQINTLPTSVPLISHDSTSENEQTLAMNMAKPAPFFSNGETILSSDIRMKNDETISENTSEFLLPVKNASMLNTKYEINFDQNHSPSTYTWKPQDEDNMDVTTTLDNNSSVIGINPLQKNQMNVNSTPTSENSKSLDKLAAKTTSTESVFSTTEISTPQKQSNNFSPQNRYPKIRLFYPRHDFIPKNKFSDSEPLLENQLNINQKLSSENKLDILEIQPESPFNVTQETPLQNIKNNTDGLFLKNNNQKLGDLKQTDFPNNEELTTLNNETEKGDSSGNLINITSPSDLQNEKIITNDPTPILIGMQNSSIANESPDELDDDYSYSEEDSSDESSDEDNDNAEEEEDEDSDNAEEEEDEDIDFNKEKINLLDDIKAMLNKTIRRITENSTSPDMNNTDELTTNLTIPEIDSNPPMPQNSSSRDTNDSRELAGSRNSDSSKLSQTFESILEYIYSLSKNPLFKDLKKQEDTITR